MKKSELTRRADQAARERMRADLLAALEEHGGDLAKVATDPRIGCDRRNLYHYAREAGLDLARLRRQYARPKG